MKTKMKVMLFGIIFGFALSRVDASEFDMIYDMFAGKNLTLAYVMASAIVIGFIGMKIIQISGNKTIAGEEITLSKKKFGWQNVVGGCIFGIGWGISGACPGTILAQIGDGKILGLFTLFGILLGTYLYAVLVERFEKLKL